MIVTWRLLSILSLVSYTESECSSTSYYRNCWIRRFPGLHVDAEESQRRGAQLLQLYRGDSAQNCSRACCLTPNFSCNVAVFHYNTTEDSVNCFHLHCPTLQSCILHQRANAILYNVTKGMDPDLLIFGKSLPSTVQMLPQLGTLNTSDLSGTDKRQFNRPHMEPSSSDHPTILATRPKTSTNAPLSVYSTQDNQNTPPTSAIQRSTTLARSTQLISTHIITDPQTDPTIVSTTKASPAPRSTMQPTFSFTNRQTSSMPQPAYTSSTTITPSQPSSQLTSSSTFLALLGTTTTSQTASTLFKTLPYLTISTTFSSGHTTTSTLESSAVQTGATPVPLTSTPESNTVETTTMPVPLSTTLQSSTHETTTLTVRLLSTLQSSTGKATTILVPLSNAPQSITGETITMSVPLSRISQSSTHETTTLTVRLLSTLQSSTGKATTILVPVSNAPQSITGETITMSVPLSRISQRSTGETTTMTVPLSSTLQSSTQDTTTMPVPLSSIPQTEETTTTPGPHSSIPQRGEATTMPVPLSSILQSSKGGTTAYTTPAMAQLSTANESLASTPLTPVKTIVTTTKEPQVMTDIFRTTSRSHNQPINTQSTASPLIEKRITQSSMSGGLSQEYKNVDLAATDVSVNTIRPTTTNRLHTSAAASEANFGLNTSPTTPPIVEDSQPYPNDTKGYISRNVTTGNSPQPVSDGGLTQVWHLAANTVLVALATCAALACGCCCSVLMAASWRGRRRRKGRYQTTLKGKKGSMRLIKYVFVRESS